jgi:hypothetical protein
MNPDESVSTRFELLFDETCRIAAAAWREAAVFVVLMAALTTATDLAGRQTGSGIAGLVAGYYLTRAMTVKAGLVGSEVKRSIWPYIGLAILSELGIALGVVLLVVPGIVIGIRWLPAYGFLLAGGEGVTQSLKSSREATRGHFMPLLIAAIVPAALFFGGPAAQTFVTVDGDGPNLALSLGANLSMYCGTILWSALGLAAYSLLARARRETGLVEVFS